jgi:hypothetical protein
MKVDRLLLKMPVRLGPMAESGGTAALVSQRVEDNTFYLLFHRPTYELTSLQRETPRIMRGARNANTHVGYHVGRRV